MFARILIALTLLFSVACRSTEGTGTRPNPVVEGPDRNAGDRAKVSTEPNVDAKPEIKTEEVGSVEGSLDKKEPVLVATGGISAGGQIQLCFTDNSKVLVGRSYKNERQMFSFVDEKHVTYNDGNSTADFSFDVDSNCFVHLTSVVNKELKHTFLLSNDRLTIRDWDNEGVQLKYINP